MNKVSTTIIIGWETRNHGHHKKVYTWCKDYGLSSVTKYVFVGELFLNERKELSKKIEKLFIAKTEKFFIASLCSSCFTTGVSGISSDIKNVHQNHFDLIQIP